VGKPRTGPVFEHKKLMDKQFKRAVRYIKRTEYKLRADSLVRKLLQNDVQDFWKEIQVMNAVKLPLPFSVEGVTGPDNVVELWRKHYSDLFNCVGTKKFSIGDVPPENVSVTAEEISKAIGKLSMGKSCGLDKITAEHLKGHYAVILA